MRCHYCSAKAAYAPDSNGVRVGLCEQHLRTFVTMCAEVDFPTALRTLEH